MHNLYALKVLGDSIRFIEFIKTNSIEGRTLLLENGKSLTRILIDNYNKQYLEHQLDQFKYSQNKNVLNKIQEAINNYDLFKK